MAEEKTELEKQIERSEEMIEDWKKFAGNGEKEISDEKEFINLLNSGLIIDSLNREAGKIISENPLRVVNLNNPVMDNGVVRYKHSAVYKGVPIKTTTEREIYDIYNI